MPSKAAQAKEPVPKHKFRLQFVPSAWAEWQKLDGSVKEPLRKLLKSGWTTPMYPAQGFAARWRGTTRSTNKATVWFMACRTTC